MLILLKWLKKFTKQKDFTLPLSKLNSLWDLGLDVLGAKNIGRGRPRHPYSQVGWVWLCVNTIIDVCNSIQLMLSTGDDEVIEAGPVYDFLFNNPEMKLTDLLSQTIGFYALFREVYWITIESKGIAPTKMLVVGPNQITPVPNRYGTVTEYRLMTNQGTVVPLFVDDVHVIKNFNPDNPYRGAGPMTAGELAISTSYQAEQFNESTIANGARLGVVLTAPAGVKLTEEEVRLLKAQFAQEHGGSSKAGKTFLASGGLDVKTVSQTMADLQMVDLSRHNANTICSLFGVPPEVAGLATEAQYSHGPATQRFILYCIAPILSIIADSINSGIIDKYKFQAGKNKAVPFSESKRTCSRQSLSSRLHYRQQKLKAIQSRKDVFAWFDIDSHPAIQEMLRLRAEKMMPYIDKGVPLNQIIDAGDLPFEHVPWGDDWWISMGQVPASYIMEGGIEAVTGPSVPEGEVEEGEGKSAVAKDIVVKKDDERQRLRIWRRWTSSWLRIENEYKSAMRVLFIRQRRELTEKLKKAYDEFGGKAVKDTDRIIARVVFDLQKENNKIKVINKTFFEKASELGIRQTLSEVAGLAGDGLDEAVKRTKLSPIQRRAIQTSAHKISKVNATTQTRVARQLRTGLEAGEGLNELTKRITDVLDGNRKRSQLIARTQTGGAVSTGRHAGMQTAGVELKSWLSARDKNVRPSHRAAETKYAAGIPLGQFFEVGSDRLMYPGDPSGSAAEIANCRCMELAVSAAGKSFDLDFYEKVNFEV